MRGKERFFIVFDEINFTFTPSNLYVIEQITGS